MSAKRGSALRLVALVMGAALALSLLTVAMSALVAPRWTARLALRTALAVLGVPDAQFSVEEASWRRLALADLSLGQTLAARRLKTELGALGPFGGLKGLAAEGLRLSGTWDEKGLSFGALDAFFLAPGKGAGAPLGFSLTLDDAAVALETPYGEVTAQSEAIAIDPARGGQAQISLAITPRKDASVGLAPHTGRLSLEVTPARTLSLGLSLQEVPDTGAEDLLRLRAATLTLKDYAADGDIWRGALALDATVDGPLTPSLWFDEGRLSLDGRLEARGRRLALFADHCAKAESIRLIMAAFSIASPALSLCSQAADRALFARTSGKLSVEGSVPPAEIALKSASEDLLAGMLPELALELTQTGTRFRAAFEAMGGTLTLPKAGLALSKLKIAGSVEGEGDDIKEGVLTLAEGELADITQSPRIATFTLEGKADVAGPRLAFFLDASVAGAGRIARIEGEHDLNTAGGKAALELAKISFAPGALQPGMLLPLLSGSVSRASGAVTGAARLSWDEAGVHSEAALDLVDLGFRAGFADIQGVSGAVKLSSLVPLETAAPQEIRIRMMDVGVPLENGLLRFELVPGLGLRVSEASFPFLSGTVFLLPFELGGGAEKKIVLAFDDVDLEALLKLVDIKGLGGTGKLTGRVPVIFEGDRQIVKDGHAEAEKPGGRLSYKSPEAAAGAEGGETEILFKALDDFRYSALSVDLTGPLDGALSLKVHLKGNNPTLYSGYPVELNVSTEGPFVSMLRKGLFAYRELDRQ